MITKDYIKYLKEIGLIIIVIGSIIGFAYFGSYILNERKLPYTIQDVHHYCCEHPEIEITPNGDNCTNVINNVYGGNCYSY